MLQTPIYFDYSSTTPVDPVVLESMLPFLKGSSGILRQEAICTVGKLRRQ